MKTRCTGLLNASSLGVALIQQEYLMTFNSVRGINYKKDIVIVVFIKLIALYVAEMTKISLKV